jgi:hypothetical protein
MDWEWLGIWYNWPFLIPFMFAIIYILVIDLLIGGIGHLFGGDTDVDVSADHDADVSVDHDVDVGHADNIWVASLHWIGVGKVPVLILLESFLLLFGGTGLIINCIWHDVAPKSMGPLSLIVALPVAFIVSVPATRWLAQVLAWLLPSDATITRVAGGFTGEWGTVISTVTTESGQVLIPGTGTIPDTVLNCTRDPLNTAEDIPCETKIVVVDYLAGTNSYTVAPMDIPRLGGDE